MLGTILSVGGALVSAFGKKKAGDAQKEAAKLNTKLVKKRTEVQTTLSERAALKGLGATKADIGAAGLAQAGSAADLLREGERDAAFDIETLQYMGDLEAKLTWKGGQAAATAGNIGAAGSIIGGITTAFKDGLFG